MENVKLEIDGKTVEAEQGTTVLQAARSIGIKSRPYVMMTGSKPTAAAGCAWLKLRLHGDANGW